MSKLSVILASLTLLLSAVRLLSASPEWSYEDRVLARCDEARFKDILASQGFRDYLNDKLDTTNIDSVELAKLAMIESFLPRPRPQVSQTVLSASNPYSGMAFYCCLQRHIGAPFRNYREMHDRSATPELDAAFFACIRDEPSFKTRRGFHGEVIPKWGTYRITLNDYAFFAQLLQTRNQAYMFVEWQRLSRFQNNPEVRDAALQALASLSPSPEAQQFSHLVTDIKALFPQVSTRQFGVAKGKLVALPEPYQHLQVLILHGSKDAGVTLEVRGPDKSTVVPGTYVALHRALRLPLTGEIKHVLLLDRCASTFAGFLILPAYVYEWQKTHDQWQQEKGIRKKK